ncbi:hypothetical protein QQ045_003616 [Rhodiola kirilowii]
MFCSIFQWLMRLSKAVRSNVDGEVERQTLTRILKNFTDIRCLKIEFPSRDDNDLLLKWKADFGSKLDKYVILYADSVVYPATSADGVTSRVRGDGRTAECHIGSCVVAAAYAKHYLLHPIVVEHSKLESLVLTDASGKGTASMNRSQLEEFRLKPSPASEGTLNMRVSYADNLELPDGVMIKGATLIVTLPSEQSLLVKQDSWVDDAFEEPYGTAVRMLKI